MDLQRLQACLEGLQGEVHRIREENDALRECLEETGVLKPQAIAARLKRKARVERDVSEIAYGKAPINPTQNTPVTSASSTRKSSPEPTDWRKVLEGDLNSESKNWKKAPAAVVSLPNPPERSSRASMMPGKGVPKQQTQQASGKAHNMSLTERIFHDRIELMRSGQGGDPMSQQLFQLEERLSHMASALRTSPGVDDALNKPSKEKRGSIHNVGDDPDSPIVPIMHGSSEESPASQVAEEIQSGEVCIKAATRMEASHKESPTKSLCSECGQLCSDGCQDFEDNSWYCLNCWNECRPELVEGATKIQSVMRGRMGRSKAKKISEAKTKVIARLNSRELKTFQCLDCGNMKTTGWADEDTGEWFCEDCWEALALEDGEEGQICADCEEFKRSGRACPESGEWFCDECWSAVEDSELEEA